MRKIKSVKTTKPYYNGFNVIPIGTPLIKDGEFWQLRYKMFIYESFNENVIGDYSYILDIEYEPEGFEFMPFPQNVIFNNCWINQPDAKNELNRLADWCDGQSEGNDCHYMITCRARTESFDINRYSMNMIHHGLKFNSNDSASLFITELNKPENSNYKKYFIELLKKTRL